MSFLLGPISGAVIAGGVYYGFSAMIRTSAEQHIHDLHALSVRLEQPSVDSRAAPSAFDRIRHRPFSRTLKQQWNIQLESLFRTVGDIGGQTVEWGRRKIHGETNTSNKSS
ncbi:hypothetical protein PHLGIDRAFT_92995 [Phlebiopsis gigantea 11061_1 CR5-6]|uniref:Found in mitochondrial proteome protein 51 n=1 Tax=Phlebiopsis gigantea (strain 11061_1 CR5-6) TaxID=745531 RepID=A0A0C3NIX9_PHLG1|nr:hypothetical protein PHLGIDRAFT_92995 [Phlebiopsis gigantea 11061_1 CR5-6]